MAGQWERAVAFFDEMLSWGIKPDVVSCTALITALGTDGQWERAEKVVEWMLRSDIKPNVRTYTALVAALGQAKQWDRALDMLQRMRSHELGAGVEPNAYTYSGEGLPAAWFISSSAPAASAAVRQPQV